VKRSRAAVVVGTAIALAIAAVSACSNQGEGERCEIENGDDDCKSSEDLVCTASALLNGANSDRCCPRDRTRATAFVCRTPPDNGTDAIAPADTGPPPSSDATVGDASDAGVDADRGDAAADAPADG
jgi:hypothetical protein